MVLLPYVFLVLALFCPLVRPQCTDADAVDSGRGTGSCDNNCGCPFCAPYCSNSGYCQATSAHGSKPADCGGHNYLDYNHQPVNDPGLTSQTGTNTRCPCGVWRGRCRRCW